MMPICRNHVALLLLILVSVLALGGPAMVQGSTTEALSALFAQANAVYQKGEFDSAERLYRQLLEKGVDSGVVYYNLGNVCFKQKKLGEALYFWEKERRRLPGDPDLRENLELAGLLVVDRIEVPQDPLPLRWLDSVVHRLTINQDCWIALILFVSANVLVSAYLRARSRRFAISALPLAAGAGVR